MFLNTLIFLQDMMDKIIITLPDGSKKEFKKGITGQEIAESIGAGLARAAVAIKVNNELYDLFREIEKNAEISILTFKDKEGKHVFWHSTAHILAEAVTSIWPEVKPTIGPPIEEGFYYDFEKSEPFTPEDLERIEKRMHEIVKKNHHVKRNVVSIDEAKKQFAHNKFKLELISDFAEQADTVTIYTQGQFKDLCRGGHVPNTGKITAFKLTKISGAYWRGDQSRESLQRIYGISFPMAKELKAYLHQKEEAEKRDHRKIGTRMDLFSFHDVSPGSPFFHPKGAHIYITLQQFLRSMYTDWGYSEVVTPLLYHADLWKTSGHWQHYRENMFITVMDNGEASMKPMNCPSHILIYKTDARSYRDLPLRITDFAPLHRNELRGTLGGLMRVRKFSQDDCHVFCTPEHVKDEIKAHINHVSHVYKEVFCFEFHVELSTKPDKAMGSEQQWNAAERALKEALDENGMDYTLNPGDGAFYGPKIDFHIKDALGRSWQCGTEQLDFQQPERFHVQFDGKDGKKHNAIMLHRTVLGSLERFMGILIEHYAGKFPLWLNPNQVMLVPIADRHHDYCGKVAKEMQKTGLRVEIHESHETTNKKIREAQLQNFNYILVVGDKEVENKTVNVRTRDEKVHGEKKVGVLIKQLMEEINQKK
jgi:threonyl-tRNA synthetase